MFTDFITTTEGLYANTSPETLPVGVIVSNPAYEQPPDKILTANTGEPDGGLETGISLPKVWKGKAAKIIVIKKVCKC